MPVRMLCFLWPTRRKRGNVPSVPGFSGYLISLFGDHDQRARPNRCISPVTFLLIWPTASMAVYSKALSADFFKLEVTSGEDFGKIVSSIAAKGVTKEATIEIKDDFFTRLESSQKWGDEHVEGQIVRLRMNSLPDKAGFGEPVQPIGFTEEEGVGESAAFIFHPNSNVLLLERNRNAVTTYTFAEFFRRAGRLKGQVNLHPLLQKDAYEKVFNAKVVRKLVVQLAGPENIGAALAEMEPSVGEMLKARQSLRAPVAEFTYTIGRRRKEGLNLEHVLGAVRDLLALNEGQTTQVEKLQVHGSSGPHHDFAVDLLENRLHGRDSVETTLERRIPYERKRDALRRIWQRFKDEVSKLHAGE
jgi:Family of unknown function (DUF6731)